MKNTLRVLCILVILSSCTTTRPERIEKRMQRKCEAAAFKWGCNQGGSDSIMIIRETKTVTEDTTIYIKVPGEIKIVEIPVEVDKSGKVSSKKSILNTSFAESRAWIENGILRHELEQKDSTIVAKIKDAIRITQIKESKKHVTQKPPERVNYITRWQKSLIIGGYILFGAVVIAIGITIIQTVRYFKSI